MFALEGQLVMAFATFKCKALGVEGMPGHICVTRQRVTDLQRTQQTSRGQGTEYPHCDSRTCEQGRRIRDALDPLHLARWRGVGFGGRFARDKLSHDCKAQLAAARRLRAVGLEDEVPTIDAEPGSVEE
jgi:hypothetical protein